MPRSALYLSQKVRQGRYRQIFTFSFDSDAAHDFIVGQAGIFGTRTVISCQPDNRVVVFVFVNGFITNFLPIKKEWFVMECGVVIFQIGRCQKQFPSCKNHPILNGVGVVIQFFRQLGLFLLS